MNILFKQAVGATHTDNYYYKKYRKYKQKYIDYQNSQEQMARIDPGRLLTFDELTEIFGGKYRFYEMYQKKRSNVNILMSYIYANFGIFKYRINVHSILKNKISDAVFYKLLRKSYSTDLDEITKFQENVYKSKKISNKVNNIEYVVKKGLNKFSCEKILDIGTEDADYLVELQEKLGCNAYGLNIDKGFSHYSTYNEAVESNAIILYDGVNIPFAKNEISLTTIIYVLHHVEHLEKFIENVCRISKVIYIKDNDIIDDFTRYVIEIQHELYEGVLVPTESSPLHIITNKQIVQLLENNNFTIAYNKVSTNFTRTYALLAHKNSHGTEFDK